MSTVNSSPATSGSPVVQTGLDVTWRDFFIVTSLFASSHALYAFLGLRFDAVTATFFIQFIDGELLSHRLAESLWYYHANPPMLNLMVGASMKIFGGGSNWFLNVIFHLLGFLTVLCVYILTLRLCSARTVAIVAAGLLVFSPSFVLYENWLMYSFPAAALLTISALALSRYLQTQHTRWAVAFFTLLAALLLTRSLFHVVWMVAVIAVLTALLWQHRKQVLLAAAVPLLLVVLWYGKNYYLFGTFASSTWMGLGLSNITTLMMTQKELLPLVQAGELSPFALVSRHRQMDLLFSSQHLPPTGIPVLDQIKTSTGAYNFNNLQMLAVSRFYARDGFTVLRRFPASYAIGLGIANRLFFSPSNMNLYFTEENREAVRPMERIFNPLLYGVPAKSSPLIRPHFGFENPDIIEVNTSIPLIAAWWLVLGYGYLQVRRALLNKTPELMRRAIVIGFIAATALYIYMLGTALELSENNRYRFLIEPLFMVLAATAVTDLVRMVRRRFRSDDAVSRQAQRGS